MGFFGESIPRLRLVMMSIEDAKRSLLIWRTCICFYENKTFQQTSYKTARGEFWLKWLINKIQNFQNQITIAVESSSVLKWKNSFKYDRRSRNNESSLLSKHVFTIEIHVTNPSLNIGTEVGSSLHHKLHKKISYQIKYLHTMSYKMSRKRPTIPWWIIQYFDVSNNQFDWIKKLYIHQFLGKNITWLQLGIRVVIAFCDWVEWFTLIKFTLFQYNSTWLGVRALPNLSPAALTFTVFLAANPGFRHKTFSILTILL